MMSNEKNTGFMAKFRKFIGILLAISVFMLALYIVSAIHVKSGIEANLQPVIDKLQQDSGAKSVDVEIYVDGENYALPWMEEFHVFLTANVKDLRRVTYAQALEILNKGTIEVKTEYSYDWDLMDYAVYNRTVTDSVTGRTHPVFVTLSDGTRNYSLKETGSYSSTSTTLHEKGAIQTLHPTSTSPMTTIFLLASFLLAVIWGALVYLAIEKAKAAKEEAEAQALASKKEKPHLGMDSILKKVDKDISDEKKRKKQERKKKALIALAIVIATLILAAALVIKFVVTPTNRYNEAVSMLNSGNVDGAYAVFEELGGFKDSEERRNEIDYTKATQALAEGRSKDAFAMLSNIEDYKDSAALMQQLQQENPYYSLMLSAPGDIVTFGAYEQDNDASNGKEPIEWIVLYSQDGELYLLSKYVLDAQPYNTGNRYACSLQSWIKADFAEAAFTAEESDEIARVGLLPEDDIRDYGIKSDLVKAQYTEYALAQDPHSGYAAGLMWWQLDYGLFQSGGEISAAVVWENGAHGSHSCDVTERCGVRPALWLFANPEDLLPEPEYTGSGPEYSSYSGSSSKSKCSSCNGTGKKLVTFYSEGDWGTTSYSSYTCTKCNGTGRS